MVSMQESLLQESSIVEISKYGKETDTAEISKT